MANSLCNQQKVYAVHKGRSSSSSRRIYDCEDLSTKFWGHSSTHSLHFKIFLILT